MTLLETHSSIFALVVSARAKTGRTVEGGTAFLVSAGGMLFLVTAAHVVQDLRDKRIAGLDYTCEIVSHRGLSLVELPHLGDPDLTFRLDHQGQDSRFGTTGDTRAKLDWLASLDIAIYPLQPDEGRALLNGGGTPFLAEDMWPYVVGRVSQEAVPDPDCLAVGFPRSRYVVIEDGNIAGLALMQGPLLPLKAINGAEAEFEQGWDSDFFSGSIGGMSGGPVLCYTKSRAYLYGVVIAEEPNAGKVISCEFLTPYRVLCELAPHLAAKFPDWVLAKS